MKHVIKFLLLLSILNIYTYSEELINLTPSEYNKLTNLYILSVYSNINKNYKINLKKTKDTEIDSYIQNITDIKDFIKYKSFENKTSLASEVSSFLKLLKNNSYSERYSILINHLKTILNKDFEIILSPIDFNSESIIIGNYILLNKPKSNNYYKYKILHSVLNEKYKRTSILPPVVNLTKKDQEYFKSKFNKDFFFPEYESIIKKIFIDYIIYNYFNNLFDKDISNILFHYKFSIYNNLIKEWFNLNEKDNIRYHRVYGKVFIDLIKKRDFNQINNYSNIFEKTELLIIRYPQNNKKLNKIINDLPIDSISYDLYQKNLDKYFFAKKVFINIGNEYNNNYIKYNSNHILDNGILLIDNYSIEKPDGFIKYSFKNDVNIFIINYSNNSNYIRLIKNTLKMKKCIKIINRNLWQKIIDFISYLISII